MAASAAFLLPLIGGILGGAGGIWSSNDRKKEFDFIRDQYNNGIGKGQFGLDRAMDNNPYITDMAKAIMGLGNQFVFGAPGDPSTGGLSRMSDALSSWYTQFPQLFQDGELRPEVQQFLSQSSGYQNALNPAIRNTTDIVDRNGVDFWSQMAQEQAQKFINGQMGGQSNLLAAGNGLLDSGGQTGFSRQAQAAGQNSLVNNGYTDTLQGVLSLAKNLFGNEGYNAIAKQLEGFGTQNLQTGGQTEVGKAAQAVGLETLLGGGQNADSAWLSGFGKNRAGREALLPTEDVLQFAREENAGERLGANEALRRRAQQRGGFEGVKTGLENRAMGNAEDALLSSEAENFRKILTGQQGLNLQQTGLGLDSIQKALSGAASREGIAAGLVPSLEGTANQRYGIGGNLAMGGADLANKRYTQGIGTVMGAEGQALANMLGLGGLANNARGTELSGMNTGGNLTQSYIQSLLSGLDQSRGIMGMERNTAQNASSLLGNLLSTGQNLGANGLNSLFQNLNFNQNKGNNLSGAMNNYFSNLGNFTQLGLDPLKFGMSSMFGNQGDWLNFASSMFGGAMGLRPPGASQNFFSGAASGAAGMKP